MVQRPIRPHRTPITISIQIPHPPHDRRNPTRTQPRRPAPNQFRQCAEELALRQRRLHREKVREYPDDHQQLIGRIALHQREERRVERVGVLELVRVLAQEEHAVVDELADDETQDLAEVAAGDEFLFWR